MVLFGPNKGILTNIVTMPHCGTMWCLGLGVTGVYKIFLVHPPHSEVARCTQDRLHLTQQSTNEPPLVHQRSLTTKHSSGNIKHKRCRRIFLT